jgi:hypothetical protein
MAINIASENNASELMDVLRNPSCIAGCGMKQPLKPFRNFYTSVFMFFLFFLGGNAVNIAFALARVGEHLSAVYLLTMLMSFILFIVVV